MLPAERSRKRPALRWDRVPSVTGTHSMADAYLRRKKPVFSAQGYDAWFSPSRKVIS